VKRAGLILLGMLAAGTAAGEPATVLRATELRQQPATDAPAIAQLPESAKVDALERQAGWTRVKTEAGAEGWVRMLLLRYGAPGAAKPQADSGVSQLLNVARTGTSGTQVTTGVRGLDAEQIVNSRPNPAELQRMEGYAASREAAAAFASSGRLQARSLEYPK